MIIRPRNYLSKLNNGLRRAIFFINKIKLALFLSSKKRGKNPYFLKIGANDGLTGDPCSIKFLSDKKWAGLLVEPVPYIFDRLKCNFNEPRFELLQAAIGPNSELLKFYMVDEDIIKHEKNLPIWYDQIGSFNINHIRSELGPRVEPYIKCIDVACVRLSDIANARRIDILHIDVEGYDFEVLKTLDFSINKPLSILLEHKHLKGDKKECFLFLKNNGYHIMDCGEDYFAVLRVKNDIS